MPSLKTLKANRILRTSVQVIVLTLPAFGIYLLFQPQIHMGDYAINNPFFPKYKWWQCLVIYLIIINLLGTLTFVLLSVHYTNRRLKDERIIPKLTNIFVNMIVQYLYSDKYKTPHEQEALFKKIKRFTRNKRHVEALFTSITRIQETIAVNHSQDFKDLLSKVNLESYIDRFLYSMNLSDKILAMRIISYLRIKSKKYEETIYHYSDSKRHAQRTEAYGALIRLMEADQTKLEEFIGSKYNVSMFDIDIIVNAVIKNHKMNIDYIRFLASTLNRKIIIGLMLAKYRYRKGSRSLILILNYLGNEEPLLNKLAWDSFLSLVPKNEGVEIIIDHFDDESDDIKVLMLKNSHDIHNEFFYNFLHKVVQQESLLVKVEAIKILFNEDFNSITPFFTTEDPEIRMALQEVSDLNIFH